MKQYEGFVVNGQGKKKSVSLSKNYMIWSKHLNNDMKNLTRLCCQINLKSTKLINYVKNTDIGYCMSLRGRYVYFG